ncbi:hypothetical protein KCP73_18595 [Salmonella enterica subsp. enterica]|nr:hypothetical protein KCP73_18595 [Salmonella enterica subsp. enterica]
MNNPRNLEMEGGMGAWRSKRGRLEGERRLAALLVAKRGRVGGTAGCAAARGGERGFKSWRRCPERRVTKVGRHRLCGAMFWSRSIRLTPKQAFEKPRRWRQWRGNAPVDD